jgi:hypothetical protein
MHALVAVLAALQLTVATPSAHTSQPSWNDVGPILAAHCVDCHRVGGIAPFSLTSAKDAKAHAQAIMAATSAHLMPPWMPAPDSPAYIGQNVRVLTDGELATLAAWVHAGAPIGAGGPTPAPPASGVQPPGSVVALSPARPYMPRAPKGSTDDYHCFVLDPHLAHAAYVTSANVQPQHASIVHHVILFDATGAAAQQARLLDKASGGRGWTCFGGPVITQGAGAGGAAADALGSPEWIAAWAPGHTTNDLPQGTGVLLPAHALVVMQVHYNLLQHKPRLDRSRVSLRLADASTTRLKPLSTFLDAAPVELPCPAGVSGAQCDRTTALQVEQRKYGTDAALIPYGLLLLCHKTAADYPSLTTSCDRSINRPVTIYAVAGHMHLRGIDIRVTLDPGTPNEKLLLHIPHWDFHWQDAYYLQQPIEAGPGDTVRVSCRFDNSADNRYVLWGEGTTDEMCLGILQFANR